MIDVNIFKGLKPLAPPEGSYWLAIATLNPSGKYPMENIDWQPTARNSLIDAASEAAAFATSYRLTKEYKGYYPPELVCFLGRVTVRSKFIIPELVWEKSRWSMVDFTPNPDSLQVYPRDFTITVSK